MEMKFGSIADLKNYIHDAVNAAFESSVVPEVQADFIISAETEVYDAYDPFYYDRQYRFMEADAFPEALGDMSATFTVNHPYAGLIEYGHNNGYGAYQYPFNRDGTEWRFLRARPYVRHAVERLEGGRYKDLLTSALNAQGLPVK